MGRVEEGRGGQKFGSVSLPRSSNRTCGSPASYVVKYAQVPVVAMVYAELRHIIRTIVPTYSEAKKLMSSLSVCHVGNGRGAGSDPLTAHVSSAFAFISRSTSA